MGALLLHTIQSAHLHPLVAALIDVNHLIDVSGYPLLIVLVMAESSGIPVPGETALIVGELVIAAAAAGAIIGDNIGYYIGRRGGRWLLQRPGPFHSQRLRVLEMGEPFFERHGPKAVFFGRFILGLRTWASWLAGANHMRWRTFFLWNALGGICWATGVGLIAYFLGSSAGNLITSFGIYGLAAVLFAAIGGFVYHRRHTRHARATNETPGPQAGGERQPRAALAEPAHSGSETPKS